MPGEQKTFSELLKAIDREVIFSDESRDVFVLQVSDQEEAAKTERELQEDYPGLYAIVELSEPLAKHLDRTEEEARLITGTLVAQMAVLKSVEGPLQDHLQSIEREEIFEHGQDVFVRQISNPEEAMETERILKQEYPGLYAIVELSVPLAKYLDRTDEEAELITGALVVQMAVLKDIAERRDLPNELPNIPPQDS